MKVKRICYLKVLLMAILITSLIFTESCSAATIKAPGTVKNLKAKAISATQAKVTWGKASRAKGYQVIWKRYGKKYKYRSAYTKKLSYTVKGLTASKKYTFKIKAYRDINGKKKYGKAKTVALTMNYKTSTSTQTVTVSVGGKNFSMTLADNDTARAFAAKLPLTLNMSELNGNEKYYRFDTSFRHDEASNPGTINEGDIMCYSTDYIVLFYKTFNTSYDYVKVGHIADTAGLAQAVGSGDVNIQFSEVKY